MTTLSNKAALSNNSLRRAAKNASDEAVAVMTASILAAIDKRDTFESADNTKVIGDAYGDTRKKMIKSVDSLARLFIASGAVNDAANVICRQLSSRSMFSAYALDKMIEIAEFVVTGREKIQKVSRCFIACAIVSADNGATVIANVDNAKFLNKNSLVASHFVSDESAKSQLELWSRGHCTNSEQTQSSQMRNVLEILNFVTLVHDDRARGAIKIDVNHSFLKLFRATFMIEAVAA